MDVNQIKPMRTVLNHLATVEAAVSAASVSSRRRQACHYSRQFPLQGLRRFVTCERATLHRVRLSLAHRRDWLRSRSGAKADRSFASPGHGAEKRRPKQEVLCRSHVDKQTGKRRDVLPATEMPAKTIYQDKAIIGSRMRHRRFCRRETQGDRDFA